MKKKQHKDEYLRGKVPQPKTTERLLTEKIEKKQHKVKYLTSKLLQPETTEWFHREKIEKKQHKLKYLKSKVPQLETERYCTEKKKTGMIRPTFIGDNTLTEVIK